MFILGTANSTYRHHLYDIPTLQYVILGLTNNEFTAARVAIVAGSMQVGDVFHNPEMYLKCVNEEENNTLKLYF